MFFIVNIYKPAHGKQQIHPTWLWWYIVLLTKGALFTLILIKNNTVPVQLLLPKKGKYGKNVHYSIEKPGLMTAEPGQNVGQKNHSQ